MRIIEKVNGCSWLNWKTSRIVNKLIK
jgi:hypothetical protein